MKKPHIKLVSAAICISMILGSINMPINNSSAAKKAKLNKTKLTLNIGKKYNIYKY